MVSYNPPIEPTDNGSEASPVGGWMLKEKTALDISAERWRVHWKDKLESGDPLVEEAST